MAVIAGARAIFNSERVAAEYLYLRECQHIIINSNHGKITLEIFSAAASSDKIAHESKGDSVRRRRMTNDSLPNANNEF